MKVTIVRSLGGLTLLLGAVLLLVPPSWVEATATAILPAFVVKDSGGNVVGPVVGFGEGVGKSPIVAYDDDSLGGRLTLLAFKTANGFLPEQGQLFYANAGCQGQAYLMPPNASGGIQALTGIGYGVGPDDTTGIGNDIWLYRSDSAGPGANIEIMSNYITSLNADFSDPTKCVNSTFSLELVTATKVINVTANFPQPYTATD